MISKINDRILKLSSRFPTNKKFLEVCDITNNSLLSELKKGRIKSPSAEVVAQIVRGTGCSGTWLLTGEGEMFEIRKNTGTKTGPGDPLTHALDLVEMVEYLSSDKANKVPPPDLPMKVAQLLVTLLEQRSSSSEGSNRE